MWRFGVIEALEDSSKLPQAELHRAKLMNKAKEILRNSELRRKGKKIYHGSHIHPDEHGYVPPLLLMRIKLLRRLQRRQQKKHFLRQERSKWNEKFVRLSGTTTRRVRPR